MIQSSFLFEGIAKTNTTHTISLNIGGTQPFEGIAKTNTTHTNALKASSVCLFEGIAKTNTTHTDEYSTEQLCSLRVLLKQIQHTLIYSPTVDYSV